jgi:hypothetical protein
MSLPAADSHGTRALRDLVRQTVLSNVGRRAALLHMDRLPQPLARPHHQRLARNALSGLADRDHAQSFELPRGRLAIVWRSRGREEVEGPMAALAHLLADLPQGQAVPVGQLMSVFDLPAQAPWLLDAIAEPELGAGSGSGSGSGAGAGAGTTEPDDTEPGLDMPLLARLEEILLQADLSAFLRWRPVLDIERSPPVLAWEERFIAVTELAQCLCPGRRIAVEGWLGRRLSRSIERRLLTTLTGPRELAGNRPFSLAVSVANILSPAFLAFDAALPAALRGRVVLSLDATDLLADAGPAQFARDFAQSRGYRLSLRDFSPGLLDAEGAGMDYLETPLTPALRSDPSCLPDRSRLILTRLDDAADLGWARAQGCRLVKSGA